MARVGWVERKVVEPKNESGGGEESGLSRGWVYTADTTTLNWLQVLKTHICLEPEEILMLDCFLHNNIYENVQNRALV